MKFSIKDFFSKCDQIHSFLRIWSHLLKKSLMEGFLWRDKLEKIFDTFKLHTFYPKSSQFQLSFQQSL